MATIIPYAEWNPDNFEVEKFKDAYAQNKIALYIEQYGHEPSLEEIKEFRASITSADLEENKKMLYGLYEYREATAVPGLTFTCTQAGGISMTNYGSNAPNIEYSKNDGAWTTWNYSNIPLVVGDVVKMKGVNASGISSSTSIYSNFTMTGNIAASGNIMSLIDGEKDGTKTIPSDSCFYKLFASCTSLTTAPELPATSLAERCYYNMFSGCNGITSAPALPAMSLARSCYCAMFYGCTKLSSITCLATAGIGENGSTTGWLNGVAATGTFTKDSSATWPSGADGIPSGWTIVNV